MMYKYSPAAMLTVSKNAKAYKAAIESGKDVTIAQKEFVSSLSKVTVGSILYTVAYLLAKAGITTGGEDDDKDIRALMKAQGYQKYSIKIGDTYFSYDWAQPVAAPFAIMSEFNRKNFVFYCDNTLRENDKDTEEKKIEEYLYLLNIENGYIQDLGKDEEKYIPKWFL